MQLMKILSAILAFFVYAAVAAPVPQNHWLIDAIHPPIPRVRPPTRTNNVEIQDLSYLNLAKPPYSRPAENPEEIYHAAPFHYAPGWEPASKMPVTDFRPTRKFGPKPNTYSDFMESNMKAAAQGLAGDKENLYGASSSSKSPVNGILQEKKEALFGDSPWFSFRPPPNANEKEAVGKKIPNSPKTATKSKEEEIQHLKDIGANVQTESSGKFQQDEAVGKSSSSSSTPVKEQEDQAVQENSSSGNTPIKEQEDQAVEENSSSSNTPIKKQQDQAVEDGSSSSNTHIKGQEDEVVEKSSSSGSTPIKEKEDGAAKQTRPSSEESNDEEEDSRSSEAYSEEINTEEEDSRSPEPPSDDAPPAKKVNPADLASSSANAPSTPGNSNLKPIKLLLKRAVKFVTNRKNGVTYKLAKVYLPDFPEAITNQPHFIGAKYRGNPIRRKYQFSKQNKDGSFLYWRPKKWNHRERHIIVYPFEEGVQARSVFQTRDESFDAPTWLNTANTSYPVDDYEEDFKDDEDDIIEDIEYYPEDLASLYDVSNSTSSPNLETSNWNNTTTSVLPRSVAHPVSIKKGSETSFKISPIEERDASGPCADHFVDISDDEKKVELIGLPIKHASEYINAPSIKGSLDSNSGYTSKAESKAGAEKEKVKEKEKSEKTDNFFSEKSEKTGTLRSAPNQIINIWGY